MLTSGRMTATNFQIGMQGFIHPKCNFIILLSIALTSLL